MSRTILVIAAHPDDTEFAAGGSIARWCDKGDRVVYLICTNGDKGSSDREMTPGRLALVREAEQRAAAKVLGVTELVFLGYPDGELEYTLEARGHVVRAIRKYRPDLVVSSDPYRKYIWHHDHRVCGQIVLDAVYPYARDHLSYPEHLAEGLQPHTVRELYLWGSDEPNFFHDISETFQRKIQALQCHASQVGKRSERELSEALGARAAEAGQRVGSRYGEQFYRICIDR